MEHLHNILINPYFSYIILFMLGICLGSFFNVVSLRYSKISDSADASEIINWLKDKKINIPNELSGFVKNYNISFPASHCYSCGNSLKWYHNIPLLSWLFLRGKCAFCNEKISIQYPLVELFGGIVSILSYYTLYTGSDIEFLFIYIIIMTLYLLLIIDIASLMLPDNLNYFIMWTSLILASTGLSIFNLTLTEALYGCILGYTSLYLIAKVGKIIKGVEAMGGGDLKLLAALGALLGTKAVLFILFLSPFLGIFSWLIFKIIKSYDKEFPFGPALIISSFIYMIDGSNLISKFFAFIAV